MKKKKIIIIGIVILLIIGIIVLNNFLSTSKHNLLLTYSYSKGYGLQSDTEPIDINIYKSGTIIYKAENLNISVYDKVNRKDILEVSDYIINNGFLELDDNLDMNMFAYDCNYMEITFYYNKSVYKKSGLCADANLTFDNTLHQVKKIIDDKKIEKLKNKIKEYYKEK